MAEKKKIRVGILFGGQSAEHEVSLQSARSILEAIDKAKYHPVLIGIDKSGRWFLNNSDGPLALSDHPDHIQLAPFGDQVMLVPRQNGRLSNLTQTGSSETLDIVFPVLHGPMGEDGTVQGLLKLAGIPYVGADVLGSAVGMDKDVMKRLLRDADIPIAGFTTVRINDTLPPYNTVATRLGVPFFVKPANLGSSIGVSRVESKSDYEKAVNTAFRYDSKIILEEFIPGREIECAVLGNDAPIASVVGEIIPTHAFYSYQAKYLDENGAKLEIPAKISDRISSRIQQTALEVFKTLSCEGMARVDFFLKPDDEFVVNEINTIPGFTAISMFPRLWQASGISSTELIDKLIQLAMERYEKEKRIAGRFKAPG